jgi:hypothetical protein
MDEFPESISVDNKDIFSKYLYYMTLKNIRKDIFEFMISRKDEDKYFDLDKYMYQKNNGVEVADMMNTISGELSALGWKTKLSFGGTGLFIYSTEVPPPSCYEDTF